MKKLILAGMLFLIAALPAQAAEKLNVVATQTFYADIVREVGGDKVDVKSIASPKFNVHFIQPKPSDVRNVAKADLVVYTGLDLEAWWGPLLEAAGKPDFFPGRDRSVDMSRGIRLLEVPTGTFSRAQGDLHLFGNPHFIMSPENARTMARTVMEKLEQIDPSSAAYYGSRTKSFEEKLDAKIAEWRALAAPLQGREVFSYHEDIEYLADFLGLKDEYFIEPKPGIPPTPKHLEFLENYAKSKGVGAILMPTYFPRDAAESLAKRVGVKVVTVYQNPGEGPGTEDIIGFYDTNIHAIAEALK